MIALLAPYGRNEVTAAALRLGDLIVSQGEEARLVALDVHETGVHPFWDGRVRGGKGDGLYQAVKGAAHCVWFAVGAAAYHRGSLVAGKATHLAVAQWHALRPDDRQVMGLYDRIACPNDQVADLVSRAFYAGSTRPPPAVHVWPWDSGLPFTRHEGLVSARLRVAVLCDATFAADQHGSALLNTVFEILHDSVCELTLVCVKSWRRRARTQLRRLSALFPQRLTVAYPRSFPTQVTVLQAHDLLLLPATKSDFGLTAARALACGLPVVCHDVSPLNDHVCHGHNGVLVPCVLTGNWLGAPRAVFNGSGLAAAVLGLAHTPSRFLALQRNDWGIDASTARYEEFWCRQLGLT